MNYIVFDLEWNQSPAGRAGEHPRMPFEIIEIGAVKLNEELEIMSEFRRLIKPKLYKKLQKYIRELLSYDEEDLKRDGVGFKEACSQFLEWAADGSEEGYAFCTWGPSDLSYLQNNMDFYNMKKLPYPLKFYDIQQIYAEKHSKDGSVSRLEKAVDEMGIEADRPFHTAVNDAYYTGRVMQDKKLGNFKEKYCYDNYRHPRRSSENIHDFHNGMLEEIMGEYPNRRSALLEKRVTELRCVRCGRVLFKSIPIYPTGNSQYQAAGKCPRHGRMQLSVKVKPAADSLDTVYIVKKITPIGVSRYRDLNRKRKNILKKKKERSKKNDK